MAVLALIRRGFLLSASTERLPFTRGGGVDLIPPPSSLLLACIPSLRTEPSATDTRRPYALALLWRPPITQCSRR